MKHVILLIVAVLATAATALAAPLEGYPETLVLTITGEGPLVGQHDTTWNNGDSYTAAPAGGTILIATPDAGTNWDVVFNDGTEYFAYAQPWDGSLAGAQTLINQAMTESPYQVIVSLPEPAALPFVVLLLVGLLKRPRARAESSPSPSPA